MVWCGSTEIYQDRVAAHDSLSAFETALDRDDDVITPSMIYAYAALQSGVSFANGAPNLTVDIPAILDAADASLNRKQWREGLRYFNCAVLLNPEAEALTNRYILFKSVGEHLEELDRTKTNEFQKNAKLYNEIGLHNLVLAQTCK